MDYRRNRCRRAGSPQPRTRGPDRARTSRWLLATDDDPLGVELGTIAATLVDDVARNVSAPTT